MGRQLRDGLTDRQWAEQKRQRREREASGLIRLQGAVCGALERTRDLVQGINDAAGWPAERLDATTARLGRLRIAMDRAAGILREALDADANGWRDDVQQERKQST